MPISRARMRSISPGDSAIRSRPRQRISPASKRPGGMSISRSTLRAVTVLPEPLSPTTASVSPGSTDRLTPSTARTVPSSVRNQVRRSRMSSSGALMPRAS